MVYVSLLFIRQIFLQDSVSFQKYAKWFKSLRLNNAQFSFLFQCLTRIVPYEPPLCLKIHINEVSIFYFKLSRQTNCEILLNFHTFWMVLMSRCTYWWPKCENMYLCLRCCWIPVILYFFIRKIVNVSSWKFTSVSYTVNRINFSYRKKSQKKREGFYQLTSLFLHFLCVATIVLRHDLCMEASAMLNTV